MLCACAINLERKQDQPSPLSLVSITIKAANAKLRHFVCELMSRGAKAGGDHLHREVQMCRSHRCHFDFLFFTNVDFNTLPGDKEGEGKVVLFLTRWLQPEAFNSLSNIVCVLVCKDLNAYRTYIT